MTTAHTFFTKLTLRRCAFPLRLRFSHNLATRDAAETLLVELRTNAGAPGHGQSLPRAYLTGETLDTAEEDIKTRWRPMLQTLQFPENATLPDILAAFRPLHEEADALRKTASYAAVECAAVDALLRAPVLPAGLPPLPLTAALPAASPRKAAALALLLRALGYRRFKVKVTKNREADESRLRAVRRAIGSTARLAVDANGAWSLEEARERIPALRAFGVTLVEEPLQKSGNGNIPDYPGLERDTGIPVMLDESLCTLSDARALLAANASPSHWNLRFAKNGGFSGVLALAALAHSNNITICSGVLVGETGVLASAGRTAAFLAGAATAEYGFSRIFLRGDPFRGSPAGYRGTLPPPTGTERGLGVTTTEAALRRRETQVWTNAEE